VKQTLYPNMGNTYQICVDEHQECIQEVNKKVCWKSVQS